METESEFGKGLTYCLGLFLAHAERKKLPISYPDGPEMWFNASSDHLYEMEIPENLGGVAGQALRVRLKEFQDKCLSWGHGFSADAKPTEEDQHWAIQEAKDLLREIDSLVLGVTTCKGSLE